ncbi:hypothetical protein VNO80_29426 [Phaseolus coccineus]|uniref:Uncharacterized protein n=1 Tax=Phaseolus coccineus TaxID=3886 RepID=A0AAN9LBF3_PHACN
MPIQVNNEAVRRMILSSCETSAEEHAREWDKKDIQGISWELMDCSRERFRKYRLRHLLSTEKVPLKEDCKETKTGAEYYSFAKYDCCSMSTEQNYEDSYNAGMVWSTSKDDVYLGTRYQIGHCPALISKNTTILDLEGHVAPSELHPGNHMGGFYMTQISAMTVRDKLLIVGGTEGQLICKHLDRPGVSFCVPPSCEPQGKINAIDIYKHRSGTIHFMTSGQNCSVKDFDAETFQFFSDFRFPWPVNHVSWSPDGKMFVAVGDDPQGKLVDAKSGKIIDSMSGHFGYTCSSAWHPNNEYNFATGNQDRTCRIWDARNLSTSVYVLEGNARGITSICFTSDGEFMAMGEDLDYVHVYNVIDEFETKQEIDIFGHVSGLSFSPDTNSLFIGVSMDCFPTHLKFSRCSEADSDSDSKSDSDYS